MTDPQRLALVRALHTVIYVVMVAAILAVVYAGLTGAHDGWVWLCLGLVAVEVMVFVGAGLKCPLTAIAVKYGAGTDGLHDTFIPERLTRHTALIFGPLIALGVALLAGRWVMVAVQG